jgi:hypothetical protein
MSQAADAFIKQNGQTVTIYTITNPVYDDYDNLDWENSTKTTTKARMIVGNRKTETPSLRKSTEGWDYQDILIVFFPSDTDISPRNGVDADVVETSDGKRFRVNRTDFDNILGVRKKKVFLEPLRGHTLG